MDEKRIIKYAKRLSERRDETYYNIYAKALAHFMFREIVEDIHAEGKITNAEMAELNKKAANRAKLFLENVAEDHNMQLAFCMEAVMCTNWDDPEITEECQQRLELYSEYTKRINDILNE